MAAAGAGCSCCRCRAALPAALQRARASTAGWGRASSADQALPCNQVRLTSAWHSLACVQARGAHPAMPYGSAPAACLAVPQHGCSCCEEMPRALWSAALATAATLGECACVCCRVGWAAAWRWKGMILPIAFDGRDRSDRPFTSG